ncbi:sulfotransferase [Candidatus Kaiserbacteria bacterium]|nr:MAG: sulfotransferase [Candidatus Kaiserbacteria bacterium]
MKKTIHFISGLPRSGSTLLCNILAQNPRFQTTATSGIMDIMFGVRNNWDNLVEFKAHPDDDAKARVLRAILDSYFASSERPVVFDKSRGWVSLLEMAEMVLERKAKVLIPVRDLRDVLASFEKIHRKQASLHQPNFEAQQYFLAQTTEGRAQILLQNDKPVGLAYHRIRDALKRGFGDRMYFVEFEKLTSEPAAELARIYTFLEEEPYAHDFENVEQVTWEDDTVHGAKDLHTIRTQVRPMDPQWKKVLGTFAEEYGKMNFWWPENQPFHEVVYHWHP